MHNTRVKVRTISCWNTKTKLFLLEFLRLTLDKTSVLSRPEHQNIDNKDKMYPHTLEKLARASSSAERAYPSNNTEGKSNFKLLTLGTTYQGLETKKDDSPSTYFPIKHSYETLNM